ncbi:hypothetical protein [Rossellomorea aquimaris]|jgi:hypothetical protein|uniref:N-acetyltransferase domain-containing protein n=1 Tax=Rossellomorea aquimaris TaxID=189382 RepID=A0A1J6VWX9_9BACI|nr:hypothetical protein [Rossellomorea aquimaris]OIU69818.1 hypothetical protein BHE18_02605 [Rossellomorea aquimaris]
MKTLKVDLSASQELLNSLSKLNTTFFSINPLLDNKSLICKKINENDIQVYAASDETGVKSLFLIQFYPYNKELAYIETLFIDDSSEGKEEMINDFISTMQSIFNTKCFIKVEEMNDNRLSSFKKIGFSMLGHSRESIFWNGTYKDQAMYHLSLEE